MSRSIAVLVLLFFTKMALYAQYYSGKFSEKPTLNDFERFIVMENAHLDEFGGKLNVRAFTKSGEIWYGPVKKASVATLKTFEKSFKNEIAVKSVHQLNMYIKGDSLSYFMLGYINSQKQLNYKIVEEQTHRPQDVIAVVVDTFIWDQPTVKK